MIIKIIHTNINSNKNQDTDCGASSDGECDVSGDGECGVSGDGECGVNGDGECGVSGDGEYPSYLLCAAPVHLMISLQ